MADITVSEYLDRKNEAISEKDQLLADHLVILSYNESIGDALRKFSGAKIIAAPVLLPNGYYRLISMLDILYAITDINNDVVMDMPVSNFTNAAGLMDLKAIRKSQSLKEAIELLGSVHKVLVLSDEGLPINIITQMDIVDWIAKHQEYLPTKLCDVLLGHVMVTSPVCVKLSDKVFDAFKICLKMNYHGIGVLDEQGNIAANLSVSLLKFLTPDNFHHLLRMSVQGFLKATQGPLLKLPKTCHYNDTFCTGIKTLHNNHIHRLYITNQDKPVGVFSTSDALALLAKEYADRRK